MTISAIVCAYNEAALPCRPASIPCLPRRGRPTKSSSSTTRAPTRRAPWRARFRACAWSTSRRKGLVVARETARLRGAERHRWRTSTPTAARRSLARARRAALRRSAALVAVTGPYRFYDWDWTGRALIRAYDVAGRAADARARAPRVRHRRDPLRRQLRRAPRRARRASAASIARSSFTAKTPTSAAG